MPPPSPRRLYLRFYHRQQGPYDSLHASTTPQVVACRLPLPGPAQRARVSRRRRPNFLVLFVFLSPNFSKFVSEIYLQTDCTLEIESRNSRAQKSIADYMYTLGAEPGERSRLHVLWEQNRGSAAGYMYFGSRTATGRERSRLHLLWEQNRGARPKRETFGNFLRCSASCEATQISKKNLRKPDLPKFRKTFRETLGRGKLHAVIRLWPRRSACVSGWACGSGRAGCKWWSRLYSPALATRHVCRASGVRLS